MNTNPNLLYEVLKVILPAIITGIFTFLITKYTYNKNRPLDKLEIAYNRIYYPLFILIKNENHDDINLIIMKIGKYLKKYNKYVDKSTVKAFDVISKCKTEAEKESAYQNFKNNIYDRCSYLRRRLGYLEPHFLKMYAYSSAGDKFLFRIMIEIMLCYSFSIISSFFEGKTHIILIYAVLILLAIIVVEVLLIFVRFLYFKIKK